MQFQDLFSLKQIIENKVLSATVLLGTFRVDFGCFLIHKIFVLHVIITFSSLHFVAYAACYYQKIKHIISLSEITKITRLISEYRKKMAC